MATPVSRKNRQKSGHSFPRPKPVAGPMPMIAPQGVDQPTYEQRRLTDRFRAHTAAIAQGIDRPGGYGVGVGSMREGAQVRPGPYGLDYQQNLNASFAAAKAAKEAQRAQQIREGIQQSNDVMDRLGITRGSQKLAEIAAASPGEVDQSLQRALRTQNPMRPDELMSPDAYGNRIAQEYSLNPETGRALRTFFPPSQVSEKKMAERLAAYKQGRKAKDKERQDRLSVNRMAGTPAWQQARLAEQFDRAKQATAQGGVIDVLTAYAGRQQAVDASGNAISFAKNPSMQAALAGLIQDARGSENTDLFAPSDEPPSSVVENQEVIDATETGGLWAALGFENIQGVSASELGSALERNLDQLSNEEFAELQQYLRLKGPGFKGPAPTTRALLLDMIREQGKVTRDEFETAKKAARSRQHQGIGFY